MMLSDGGAPVQPDAAGCCVGLRGFGSSGYQSCATEPTTCGFLYFAATDQAWLAFTCERHAVVLTQPRPLTADDVLELDRRRRTAPHGT